MSEIAVTENNNIEEILERDGVYASVTNGCSMRPLFKTHRDMIVVTKPTKKLSKYDVALYRVSGKYILHRVIGIDEGRGVYIIRGDNTYSKEYIPFKKVIGVLVSFNRKGKRHDVTERGYRIYSVMWNAIYPLRYLARAFLSVPKRLLRKIFRKRSKET
ncbi:MAG: S24/S26 family peptidase [Clostridia bacterium]|nr:S24/S26 family peptidase [Clostridia bacterium]